jgi:biuret amidohydrolase
VTALAEIIDPSHTALVTQECQNGSIGSKALWPALATAASDVIPNIATLVEAARVHEVPVIHCIVAKRSDFRGANNNAPLFKPARRKGGLQKGTAAGELIDQLGPDPKDFVLTRGHSVSPFSNTGLDSLLRNLGSRTVIVTGVSVNVAIFSAVMDGVNAGYRMVVPRDAVAGVPDEYAQTILEHSLSLLADVIDTSEVIGAWRRP